MKGHMESMYEDQPYRKPERPIAEETGIDHAFDTVMAAEIDWNLLDEAVSEVISDASDDAKAEGLPYNQEHAHEQMWDEIDNQVHSLKDLETYDIEIYEKYLEKVGK